MNDSLLSHGVSYFLKESMMERSDGPSIQKGIPPVYICMSCGLIGVVNKMKNIYFCNNCNNKSEFKEIHIPYTAKLLIQELGSMSIALRCITDSEQMKWKKIQFTEKDRKGINPETTITKNISFEKVIGDINVIGFLKGKKHKNINQLEKETKTKYNLMKIFRNS